MPTSIDVLCEEALPVDIGNCSTIQVSKMKLFSSCDGQAAQKGDLGSVSSSNRYDAMPSSYVASRRHYFLGWGHPLCT